MEICICVWCLHLCLFLAACLCVCVSACVCVRESPCAPVDVGRSSCELNGQANGLTLCAQVVSFSGSTCPK